MARIEGITIENYRALRKVTFGETFEYQDGSSLPSMMAVIGPNGSGKVLCWMRLVFSRVASPMV